MKCNSRLSGVLHILLHMAEADGPVTSEVLAKAMKTNPVVIRRIMGDLRDQNFVQSEKGHGGGWTLTCNLERVTLLNIYLALGAPELFAMGNRTESPDCLVEQAVNAALDSSFKQAQALLLGQFEQGRLLHSVRIFIPECSIVVALSIRRIHMTNGHSVKDNFTNSLSMIR